jgi:hypothetical protein
MPLLASQLSDLVTLTLRDLGKPKITDISTDTRNFIAWNELINDKQVKIQSGFGLQWSVMVNHSQSARHVGIAAQDDVDITDTTVQAQADWRHATVNYAIDAREIDMNREPSRIVDLVKVRRHAAMVSWAELFENTFWGPPVAANDNLTPWGVKTWIVKNASEGFNGGAPAGYTTIGLNPTTYPRWKNYTGQYTSVTKDDLVRMWRKAATKCNFKPPVRSSLPSHDTGDGWGYYTNYDVVAALEELLEGQNDNLGNDVASKDGKTLFRRVPVTDVPKLETDTTNPVYGIKWGSFHVGVLRGWWMKEYNEPHHPGQHTLSVTYMDTTYQPFVTNRRCHFVLATSTAEPS